MIDVYLLLTPILALGVLALVRFIGCDLVFTVDPGVTLDAPGNFVARPGNHVDELQRHAGLALGADREPPRCFDSQQHLSISRSADGGT